MTDKLGKAAWLQGAGGGFSNRGSGIQRQQGFSVEGAASRQEQRRRERRREMGSGEENKHRRKGASGGREVPRGCAGDIVAAIVSELKGRVEE